MGWMAWDEGKRTIVVTIPHKLSRLTQKSARAKMTTVMGRAAMVR